MSEKQKYWMRNSEGNEVLFANINVDPPSTRFTPIPEDKLDAAELAHVALCAQSYYMLPDLHKTHVVAYTINNANNRGQLPKNTPANSIDLAEVWYDGNFIERVHANFLRAAYTAVPEPQTIAPDEAAKLMYDAFHVGEER